MLNFKLKSHFWWAIVKRCALYFKNAKRLFWAGLWFARFFFWLFAFVRHAILRVFKKSVCNIHFITPVYYMQNKKGLPFANPFGADRRIRTADLFITSELLCQLSYISTFNFLFATLAEPKALPHCEHSSCGLWLMHATSKIFVN